MNHDQKNAANKRRDGGMTLIELLITISVLGTIITVIGAAVIVTVRQQPVTRSRIDVAAWEQSLALWLPADLSSAGADPGDVNADETAPPPCGDAVCTFGSNALQLRWNDGSGETVVSYRYGPAADGDSFELRRVTCYAGSCNSLVVLRDLAVPSDDDGNPIPWAAGDEVPDTVINVTVPLAVGSSGSCDPLNPTPDCDTSTRAQRVIVNVNGAPGLDGVDRSSTVSFTAGGSSLSTLTPATFSGPTFLQANSGCGGPITLIVDRSASLSSSDFTSVRSGVRSFVNAFDGTPTKLQIITFGTVSSTLGTTSWNRFFDLADPGDVELLMGPTGNSGLISDIVEFPANADAGTNWEDALHRAYFSQNGETYEELGSPAAPPPELVIFFTDGRPTLHRGTDLWGWKSTDSSSSPIEPPSVPSRFDYDTAGNTSYGADFSPLGWYRADYIIDQFRDIRLIGVGVGSAFNETTRVRRSGWPTSSSYRNIDNEVFLGDLAAGGDPSQNGTSASGGYVVREYDGSWGDVTNANMLVTTQWPQFGSALQQIALAECGGTLTVQTRDLAGQPADASITYQIDDKVVTTSRIAKAATFDIPLNGVPSTSVDLIPQSFEDTGYAPASWNCRSGGADLTLGSDYDLITPGTPGDGISVTVSANAAVSCTLSVSP